MSLNPLLNPNRAFSAIKNYLFDIDRLNKNKPEKIRKYKDKMFKKVVNYAYNTPVYHDKYKKAGIHPSDIKGISDIKKLPMISKEDLKKGFPNKITPKGYNIKKSHIICTGGTTGRPVYLYTDFMTIQKATMSVVRELRNLGFGSIKLKTAHIGNFSKNRIDLVTKDHFHRYVKFAINNKNMLNIDVNTDIIEIIDKLDVFQPDLLLTYPAILQHLAYLKRKGYGKNVKPKLCWAAGAMLDDYTRIYVEEAFSTRLLNIYPSVEAGMNIAFECFNGTWHVHDDFFHLEVMDEDNTIVTNGTKGHLVLTKLYGTGTPIVRYTGMDDWVKISGEKNCECGLCTTVVEGGVEGRMRANIVLPNGKIFPPGAFCFIEPILHRLKTFKVRRYQIVQKKIDEIDILIVIDEDLRNVGPSVDILFDAIKQAYIDKVGPDVSVNVKEVSKIKNFSNSNKPPPTVLSHVSIEDEYYER